MLEKDSPKTKQDEEQRAMQKCVSKQIEKAGKPWQDLRSWPPPPFSFLLLLILLLEQQLEWIEELPAMRWIRTRGNHHMHAIFHDFLATQFVYKGRCIAIYIHMELVVWFHEEPNRSSSTFQGNPTSPNSCVRERDSRAERRILWTPTARNWKPTCNERKKERKKAGHFSATAAPQVVTTLTATLTQQCGSSKRDGWS